LEKHFGSWKEVVRSAGLEDNFYTQRIKTAISKFAQPSERLLKLDQEKASWEGTYTKPKTDRFQTILCGADIHDQLCDPFYRRLFVDTAKRVQPTKIVLNGDTFEMFEFSRYTKDPRKLDIVGSIKWVQEFLKDLRESCQEAEIVMVEGNHDLRVIKFLTETNPNLMPILADIHGMEFPQLVGIDKYEVNYIGKASLAVHKESDLKKEIAKNYYLAYDSILFHHFPYAKNWGYAGVNGHHHKHLVSHHYNALKGPYEWHQLGAGHVRQAEYCEGEVWQNGFILCHVDTHKKYNQFEYIDCTGEHCVIGGKWYSREPHEIVKVWSK
jgi:predicted phosphodiesterase